MITSLSSIIKRLAAEELLAQDSAVGTVPGGEIAHAEYSVARDEIGSIEISDVTLDSRAVRRGSLFCAVRGTTADSHTFLSAAADAGAAAALVERPDPTVALPQVRVTNGRHAAAIAAAEFFGDPWREMTLVGITGTNGKTTTAAILRHLLSGRGPSASIGTLGVVDAEGAVVPGTEGLTTPSSVDTARWLEKLRAGGTKSVTMEVSSHALDQGRVAAVRFDAALLTNLSRDHLDYHPSLEDYRQAKLRLLDALKPDGVAVLNADDPAWDDVGPADHRIIRFSLEGRGEVNAEGIRVGRNGMLWTLNAAGEAAEVQMSVFGLFNVANAVGAAAVLWSQGWRVSEIAEGLRTLPQVPGRLERVPAPAGAPLVLIDFAHTPDALAGALSAVRPLIRGRLFVVFGAGGGRDPGKRPEMGRVASELADVAIVTSDNPRDEDPETIIDQIEEGMVDAHRQRVPDRRRAIETALRQAGSDDLVLLAGKGHERYQIIGTTRHEFDERDVVREIFDRLEAANR